MITLEEIIKNEDEVTVNSTLRHEEHIKYDEALLDVARQRLNGIEDLRSKGLVMNLNGLGTTISRYERMSDMTKAEINMEGMAESLKDRLTFDEVGVPIPIIHKDWTLNIRQLEASRMRGSPLSTDQLRVATRIVVDEMEGMLFNGVPSLTVDGRQIYGYTTFPSRTTLTLHGSGWSVPTDRDIIGDVERMLSGMYRQNRFGPFYLYVAKNLWADIQMDYNENKGDKTFMERIMAFSDIEMVKPGDQLPDNNVVLVQMTTDSVDLAVGQDLRNIQWETNPMMTNFKVYSALAPRIKSDVNGSCGIVHGSV